MNADCMRILRFPEVVNRTGLSRSSVYGRIRAGEFPTPVALGSGRAVGFLESDVQSWIDSLRFGPKDQHSSAPATAPNQQSKVA